MEDLMHMNGEYLLARKLLRMLKMFNIFRDLPCGCISTNAVYFASINDRISYHNILQISLNCISPDHNNDTFLIYVFGDRYGKIDNTIPIKGHRELHYIEDYLTARPEAVKDLEWRWERLKELLTDDC